MTVRLLVTGANGFLGARLIEQLIARGEVTITATYRRGKDRLPPPVDGNPVYLRCDLADGAEVVRLFAARPVSAVIHTAAALPGRDVEDLRAALRDNVAAQTNLVHQALAQRCRRFIYCSTISVYEGTASEGDGFSEGDAVHPSSVYGHSKYAAEQVLALALGNQTSMTGASLRLAGVHGPGRDSGVVHRMLRAALDGRPLVVEEPRSRFRTLFVDDAVEAVLSALRAGAPGTSSCYNVAGKEIHTLEELATKVLAVSGSCSAIEVRDNGRMRNQVMDITRIESELGFRPRPLEQNLAHYCRYLKAAA